jgi:hypothetical protein
MPTSLVVGRRKGQAALAPRANARCVQAHASRPPTADGGTTRQAPKRTEHCWLDGSTSTVRGHSPRRPRPFALSSRRSPTLSNPPAPAAHISPVSTAGQGQVPRRVQRSPMPTWTVRNRLVAIIWSQLPAYRPYGRVAPKPVSSHSRTPSSASGGARDRWDLRSLVVVGAAGGLSASSRSKTREYVIGDGVAAEVSRSCALGHRGQGREAAHQGSVGHGSVKLLELFLADD